MISKANYEEFQDHRFQVENRFNGNVPHSGYQANQGEHTSGSIGMNCSEPPQGPSPSDQFKALSLLSDAWKLAITCRKSPWEFAIEIKEFIEQGISRSLLRWLVCNNLIEHRIEARSCNDSRRQFFEAPNLVLNEQSCFVLSSKGHDLFSNLSRNSALSNQVQNSTMSAELNPIKPIWCANTRTLKINGYLVKQFKWPAPNQEKLIAAFAEEGWPRQIDDPLVPNQVCPKRRLHDTIKCLNRNQAHKLIKFRGDGTGQGVYWEYRPENLPNS